MLVIHQAWFHDHAVNVIWPLLLAVWLPSMAAEAVESTESGTPTTVAEYGDCLNCDRRWSGLPWIDRHTPAEHGAYPVSFAVQPLPGGEVFVANAEGLLRLVGGRWELLDLPSLATARSLAWSEQTGLLVGGYHHFGQLLRGNDGRYTLKDLDEGFFPDRHGSPLAEVWDIHLNEEGVWFETDTELLLLSSAGERHRFKTQRSIAKSFSLADGLWLREEGGRLSRIRDGQMQQIASDFPVITLLWREPGGQLLALADEHGFIRIAEDGQWSVLPGIDEHGLLEASPYASLRLDDGGLLFGCLNGDLYWFDSDLNLLQRWPVSRFPILGLATDAESGLWATTEGEVLRLDLREQWRHLGPGSGYGGTLNAGLMTRDGTLLGTSVGLYLDHGQGRIELAGLEGDEVRDLWADGDGVLIAASSGIHRWHAGELTGIAEEANVLWMLPSSADRNLLYAVEDSGLLIIERSVEGWREAARVVDPAYRFQSLAEDPRQAALWAGQINDDPFRVSLTADRRQILAAERVSDGIERPAGTDSNALRLADEIVVGTRNGLFRWLGERFQPAAQPALEALVAPRFDELVVLDCGAGMELAWTSRSLLRRQAGGWQLLPLPGNRSGHGVVGVECNPAGGAMLATWNGLSWYRQGKEADRLEPPPVMLESVLLQPSLDKARYLPLAAAGNSIPAGSSLHLRFAHPALAGGWRVQSRLQPIENGWQWHAAAGDRQLTALTPGAYALQLRAIDSSQRSTEQTEFAFVVDPPWHGQRWVQLLALAALLALVWWGARWRTRRLERRNRQLQAMVAERTQRLWQRTAELEAANQKLQALADQDGLTGVPNRRRLDLALESAFAESLRNDQSLALLMIDLDHFKQFNDTHGHQRGDERLAATAAVLQRALRWPRSLLARYGGEEFVAILPDASLDDAHAVAEKLLQAARGMSHLDGGQTISIGLAERRRHSASQVSELLAQADQALYAAKREGRDRARSFTPPTTEIISETP